MKELDDGRIDKIISYIEKGKPLPAWMKSEKAVA